MSIRSLPGRRATMYDPTVARTGLPSHAVSVAVWVAMRGTGLLLSVLVLGHLLFVHLLTDVAQTSSSFVARRWSGGLWVTWDGIMLTAAFLHGAIGMTTVVRDYTGNQLSRRAWLVAVYTLSAALTGLGWYAIVATVVSSSG
jgi:succinate dehydrogenase / fumarate reductase membrane anchor subunit